MKWAHKRENKIQPQLKAALSIKVCFPCAKSFKSSAEMDRGKRIIAKLNILCLQLFKKKEKRPLAVKYEIRNAEKSASQE